MKDGVRGQRFPSNYASIAAVKWWVRFLRARHAKISTTGSLCSNSLFSVQKCSFSASECQWIQFFLHSGILFHTFDSYTILCQSPFCQIAPLLPFAPWQQNVTEYWQEGSASTSIPPSASDFVGQNNKKNEALLSSKPSIKL